MAKKVSEFEKRPEVKEAVPIPLERQRPTGWIVATVVLALVAICAVGYIVVDGVQKTKKAEPTTGVSEGGESEDEATEANSEESEEPEEAAASDSSDEKAAGTGLRNKSDYDEIIDESLAVLKGKLSKDEMIVVDNSEVGGAYVKIADGGYTSLDYGRSVGVVDYYTGLENERGGDLGDKIANVFTKHGFKKDNSILVVEGSAAYTDGKGSFCQFRGSWPMVVCGHESWISDKNMNLAKQLWAAYTKNNKPTGDTQILLLAKTGDVKNSPVSGYQRLSASTQDMGLGFGAAALFYKKDGEEWKYFRSAQAVFSCKEYTGDIAKAFAGTSCMDESTGETKKVGE